MGASKTLIPKIAVLGASPKKERYSNKAVLRLRDAGYSVVPINPAYSFIEGIPTVKTVNEAAQVCGREGIHTLSLYIAPSHLEKIIASILVAQPRRVIFNPGTEYVALQKELDSAKIFWIEACTLTLLSIHRF